MGYLMKGSKTMEQRVLDYWEVVRDRNIQRRIDEHFEYKAGDLIPSVKFLKYSGWWLKFDDPYITFVKDWFNSDWGDAKKFFDKLWCRAGKGFVAEYAIKLVGYLLSSWDVPYMHKLCGCGYILHKLFRFVAGPRKTEVVSN